MYKLKKGWTKKKVMNKIKKYNNGSRSRDADHNLCLYEFKGNRCAIGCFIPNNHEALSYMGSVSNLLGDYPELKKNMPFSNVKTLEVFQKVHDTAYSSNVYDNIENFLETKVK